MADPSLPLPLFCVAGLDARSADGVIAALAARLVAGGVVAPTFERAAVAREKRSPTGLPFDGGAVAIPHAEPEHVVAPAIAIATLASPVKFRQMGTPQIALDVRLVVVPALSAKEQAAAGLTAVIEKLQDAAFRAALLACKDDGELERAWSSR
jgi:PTS system galactitol-specific IIA component